MNNKVQVNYEYMNRERGLTRLWLAWPDREKVTNFHATRSPSQRSTIIDQELAYFELEAGESVQLSYTSQRYSSDKSPLSYDARSFYLMSSVLSPVNDEIRKLAQEITTGSETESEKAKRLFEYLVEQFQYVYPPKSRGSSAFLIEKKGDCGEYSFLYAALCRALQIPCRTIVGTWAVGKMQAHVWNEVYIEETGWIPVDCSMAYIQKKKKWQFLFSDVKTLPWRKYFGSTEGQRIVFSFDAEIPLKPEYTGFDEKEEASHTKPASFFKIEKSPFYWGYQSLKGAAPYLQPAYVKFDNKNLLEEGAKIDNRSYLGEWTVKESGLRGFTFLLKRICFAVIIIGVILGLLVDNDYLTIINNLALVLVSGSFLIRGERPLLFGPFTVVFLLGFLSAVSG
ncbi:transglutaminase-like domain-containing protein [Sutcliffiella deserti]|uniref:transglutaminase-like domain-containing protein n=1 Tax=Sutcliffiella deserti TaxID=2875501 RepID=UPI001CBD69BA|nr:transglutaminase-like domain-containing protein [Sutcliffiella deserti]